jgi:hypothetical protein
MAPPSTQEVVMAIAQGKKRNAFFRLGKGPARRDERNLQLRALLKKKVRLPAEYDFDLKHPAVPTPMFGNDEFGCCVISGRAHQTLRFEIVEQKRVLRITEKEVVDEYFEQSGGLDSGLIMLDSLRLWRKQGWVAAKRRYAIRAFSEVDRTSMNEVKTAIFMNLGVGIGLRLPASAELELKAGKPWTTTTGTGSRPNSWGGHYVYVSGYTKLGPTCVTWGSKQQMSWAFFAKYCDEAYAMIDALNTPGKRAMIDAKKLDAFLATVSKPTVRGMTSAAPKSGTKGAKKSGTKGTRRSARRGKTVKFRKGKDQV